MKFAKLSFYYEKVQSLECVLYCYVVVHFVLEHSYNILNFDWSICSAVYDMTPGPVCPCWLHKMHISSSQIQNAFDFIVQ